MGDFFVNKHLFFGILYIWIQKIFTVCIDLKM